MAKRKKLEAPSTEDLSKIEEEFRRETSPRSGMAPIAQVAGEAAGKAEVLSPEERAKTAEMETHAKAFADAEEKGLLLADIPIEKILATDMTRDRLTLERDQLDELKASIIKNGLRMPIEVYRLSEPQGDFEYGLISGYRRLLVVRECFSFSELPKYATIKAIVRAPENSADSLAAMVEENEVRASISPFERGRIAAISAQEGVFVNVEDAVANLFPFASKAKRSKIRSFALVFEEIGDLLSFAETLSEKQGLRLAGALRDGAEGALREALSRSEPSSPREEWQAIEGVLEGLSGSERDAARGGRPSKKVSPRNRDNYFKTDAGIEVGWERDGAGGYLVHLKGKLHSDTVESLVADIKYSLSKPRN